MNSSIPAEAVARFRRLKSRADMHRAATVQLGEREQHYQRELEIRTVSLVSAANSHNVEAGDDGLAYYKVTRQHTHYHRGNPVVTFTQDRDRAPVSLDTFAADVAKARRKLAEVTAERDALDRQRKPLFALVAACEAELKSRGWREYD